MGLLSDLLVLTNVLTLWMCTKFFTDSLQNSDENCDSDIIFPKVMLKNVTLTMADVKSAFYKLWTLACLINDTSGSTLGLFIMESLFYYSTYFNAIFGNKGSPLKNAAKGTILLIYFVEAFASLWLCGDISNKVAMLFWFL